MTSEVALTSIGWLLGRCIYKNINSGLLVLVGFATVSKARKFIGPGYQRHLEVVVTHGTKIIRKFVEEQRRGLRSNSTSM